MEHNGIIFRFLFPSCLRLYGLKMHKKIMLCFFLNVDIQKSKIGYLSAMIPKTNNVGIHQGQLTLTNNIPYCSKTDDFFMHHHKLKLWVLYNKQLTKQITQDTFVDHFSMCNKASMKLVQFVYLNKLFMDSDSKDNKYLVQ